MIYSGLVKKACEIMYHAHRDQIDKGGYPYILHPFYVAMQMDDEASTCTALLHDVIEDHGDLYSFEYLKASGFSPEILEALRLLTHNNQVPYMEYICKIAENPIATKVKLADLSHNLDESRTGGKRTPKYDTYVQAYNYLSCRLKK